MIETLLTTAVLHYLIFGALGGLLYIARQKTKGHLVERSEFLSRPLFGAVTAVILTISLGLPNHLTSLMAGYFGIDLWDTLADRFKGKHFLNYTRDLEDQEAEREEAMRRYEEIYEEEE